MMRFTCLALFFLTALPALPAHAGLFSWLMGGEKTSVECPTEDRACIWQSAVDMVFANAAGREVEMNTDHYARQLFDLSLLQPAAERADVRRRLVDADEHHSFLESYDNYLRRLSPPPAITLAELETALRTQAAPDGGDFHDYVEAGFEHLLAGPEAQQATALWYQKEYSDLLWDKGWRAYRLVQQWLAENDVDAFVDYTDRFNLSGRSQQTVWADLGRHISSTCQNGEIENGTRVLDAATTQLLAYDTKDPIIWLYSLSEMFSAVLHCKGLMAAEKHMARINQARPQALAFLAEKYPDKAEHDYVFEAVHDTVEIRTDRELAIWLYMVAGDRDAARVAFEAGQATVSVWGFGPNADGQIGLRSEGQEPMPFATFERDIPDLYKYSEVPQIALTYLVDRYDPATFEAYRQTGYYLREDLNTYLDQVEAGWPDPIARQGAQKIMTLTRQMVQKEPDFFVASDQFQLRLAALPQSAACALSDARLRAILERLPDYEYIDARVKTLTLYIRYLDRAVVPDVACVPAQ